MTTNELVALLDAVGDVRIGILGDFCLDAYLLIDPAASEASVETGLHTRPVKTQRYSLGGAGNVAANLLAMGAGHVAVFGVAGSDPFGAEMRSLLVAAGADTAGLLVQRETWDTHVYLKPHEAVEEQQRIDFGNFNELSGATQEQLLRAIEGAMPALDILIVNQQVIHGVHTPGFRSALQALLARHPGARVIIDSRHYPDAFGSAMRKINLAEASRVLHGSGADPDALDEAGVAAVAQELHARWGQPLFLTRGERGVCVCNAQGFRVIPGLLILGPVDPVGAGDSMLAGIAAGLATGADPVRAAELGTLVAGVTVQKLLQTGTATREEIVALGSDPDFRYHPDRARQPRPSSRPSDADVEIITTPPLGRNFTHVIFDHDGTISTLRQGWERIMEPMMVRVILGDRHQDVAPALLDEVTETVRAYIDQTTGVQTLVQMKGLADLVRRFACVPERAIRDAHGYKAMYDQHLLALVEDRMQKLGRGELQVADLTIKKAVDLLRVLAGRGVQLYLASGTDQVDVEREAEALGYRAMFGGRIFGGVGDVSKEAKRIVLERILERIGADGRAQILTIGDGPVEMRETHKRGGYALGVASDEVRRYGWNDAKRRRLIEAGADMLVPDFSQLDRLLVLLFP
jgi:bifunctional ADP-heptose synthase (sugar kinase/adenylyltransferase)/phosphoglycolate phosphatase-like HAD superfamily hydrolase